jgi:Polyketide cyclase / dehydrase and lipid transport
VAAYAADPDNVCTWYRNIKRVEWLTERPLRVGTRLAFAAEFLGRRMAYTYEVVAHEPGERLVMRTADGPFPMETTYVWADGAGGTTVMALRNRGEPAGFSAVASPMMSAAIRRANRGDLRRLKAALESEH